MIRTLGLVPARGGSKGVPRKNVRPLRGKPLLQYTAEAACAATLLTRVVLSTDDPDIAAVGERCGLDVPFLRPAHLADDQTPTLPVVRHALDWLAARGEHFDAVCILQPTTPLRPASDIDRCIRLLETSAADTVVTIVPVPPECNPHWVYFRRADGTIALSTGEPAPIPRRQDLPPAFRRDGSVYVVRTPVVIEQGTLFGERVLGLPVDPGRSVDINTAADWASAERLLASAI